MAIKLASIRDKNNHRIIGMNQLRLACDIKDFLQSKGFTADITISHKYSDNWLYLPTILKILENEK